MTMSLSKDSTTTTTIMAKPGAPTQNQSQHVHKRRSSTDSDDELLAAAASPPHIPQRPRMISAPSGYGQHTRSVSGSISQNHILPRPTLQRPPGLPLLSPVRTSFHLAPPPHGVQVNGHSRARSISAFSSSPLTPSPLSTSIQLNNNNGAPSTSTSGSKTLPPRMQASHSAPEIKAPNSGDVDIEPLKRQTPQSSRRSHNRIHSRNLSIYFPRPSSLPTSTISELEDGTQEVSIPDSSPVDEESGRTAESKGSFSGNSRTGRMRKPLTPLGQGFTFGSKPPSSISGISGTEYPITNASQPGQPRPISSPVTVTRTRRGHHHKHSLSHNFFSFLEPGYSSNSPGSSPGIDTAEPEPNVQSIPVSVSSTPLTSYNGYGYDSLAHHPPPLVVSPTFAKALSITNLSLGATLWVSGQQAGSLACTGLGYWVVYDAIGLALSRNFDFGLGSIVGRLDGGAAVNQNNVNDKDRGAIRKPYGAARLSTLLTFAQSVYLMFSAIYVCKETIEHVLLSAGEAQGHHHHPGDESSGAGLELPLILTSITFFSLLGSALLFDSNSGIVNITQTRIPPPLRTIRSFLSLSDSQDYHGTPRSRLINVLTNPFVLSPLIFCLGILVIGILVSHSHQRLVDLLLASLIAFITFNLAYRACVILGTVLLQTSPARTSIEKGRVKTVGKEGHMEAFLRAMREVERHPHVLHLPAPHIWQIAPGSLSSPSSTSNQISNLVVTLELHVRAELGDEDVLELTHWAWERVVIALGGSLTKMSHSPGKRKLEGGKGKWVDELPEEEGGPEVTVGIVRG